MENMLTVSFIVHLYTTWKYCNFKWKRTLQETGKICEFCDYDKVIKI